MQPMSDSAELLMLSSIFADRPDNIRDAFVSAVEDLETAISGLSDAQKNKVFREGERFSDGERLGDARRLDNAVVEALLGREACE